MAERPVIPSRHESGFVELRSLSFPSDQDSRSSKRKGTSEGCVKRRRGPGTHRFWKFQQNSAATWKRRFALSGSRSISKLPQITRHHPIDYFAGYKGGARVHQGLIDVWLTQKEHSYAIL